MQWLFDHNGVRYLDLFGGIVTVSVGHCHPWVKLHLTCWCAYILFCICFIQVMIFFRKINEATKKQLDKVWHTTNIYLHPKIHEYAERLVATLPGDLKVSIPYLKKLTLSDASNNNFLHRLYILSTADQRLTIWLWWWLVCILAATT